MVGDEDADLAVAEVVELRDKGVVLLRVLPGPAAQHLHLVPERRTG